MQKIFYEDADSKKSPSSRIFFCEQLPLMIQMNLFERVSNVQDADIIFATVNNYKLFIDNIKKPIIIYKPHLEIDTYLKGKSLINLIKALVNRLLLLNKGTYLFLSDYNNVFYIADNRRIWRTLRNYGKNSFHLKLIPYPVFSVLKKSNLAIERNCGHIVIGCIGEASVYNNLFRNFDFNYWLSQKIEIKIFACFYGPATQSLFEFLSNKTLVNRIEWPANQFNLSILFSDVDFFIVPHSHYLGNYGLNIHNIFSPSSNQANNYISKTKFSCNAGRNYLAAGLNKIFISQPTEELISEFPNYPNELLYEDYRDINAAILAFFQDDVRAKALNSIEFFRQSEYLQRNNLTNFSKWCGELVNDL